MYKKRPFHIIPFDNKHTQQAQKKRQNIPTYLTLSLLPPLQTHSITHLDHVFANAGILPPESLIPASTLDISWIRQSLEINTIAPILLYQATKPLLDRAENPKFVVSTLPIPSACHIYRRYIDLISYNKRAGNNIHYRIKRLRTNGWSGSDSCL